MSMLKEKPAAVRSPEGAAITLNGRYQPPPEDKDGKLWVRTSAVIQAEAHDLYAMWRDLTQAPAWQEEIKEVTQTSDRHYHWVMAKDDKTIEWDSELIKEEPGHRLAWRSTGADVDTAGEVIFEAAPNGRGTMVTVLQEMQMGKLASLWETLTGRSPKQRVIENLRHFKALAETGEIPRTQGQPHGPRGTIGGAKASTYGETTPVPAGAGIRQAS